MTDTEKTNETSILTKEYIDIFIDFSFKLLKFLTIKGVYDIFMYRNLIFSMKFQEIFNILLSFENISLSLSMTSISFLYKLILKTSYSLISIKWSMKEKSIKLMSACVSLLLFSLFNKDLIGNKSFKYYLLFLLIRIINLKVHNIDKNYFNSNRLFICFLFYFIWELVYYLNPGYNYIIKAIGSLSCHSVMEKLEFKNLCDKMRII